MKQINPLNYITNKENTYQKNITILLLVIIPYMILTILTHKIIFIEFSFLLLVIVLYNLKKLFNLKDELNLIQELETKIEKSSITKVYPKGHHIITNPQNIMLDIGAYKYIGTIENGVKLYQNITDIIVIGTKDDSGNIIYDELGLPLSLINKTK